MNEPSTLRDITAAPGDHLTTSIVRRLVSFDFIFIDMKRRCGMLTESKIVLGNIPHEVISDIFTRLSVKDLLRCRCVSKSWCSLISDPVFVRNQVDTVQRISNLSSHMHISINADRVIKSVSYQTLECKKLKPKLPIIKRINYEDVMDASGGIPCEYLQGSAHPEFLCSCDGLVLIRRCKKDHFLWNPSIRTYKQIPFDFSNYEHSVKDSIQMYGIGYDKSTDAYKIVRIVHILKPKVNRRLEFTARTYNCKTKCWKRIHDFFPYKIFKNAQGVVLNGVPHWIVAREDNEKEHVIIYFDVVDDTIEEIETPLPCSLGADFTFSNFEGSLCLVTTTERFSKIWVLKEDGATKSWKKLFKFKKDMDPYQYTIRNEFWFNVNVDNFVPLCKRNKAILFVRLKDCDYMRLLTYDPESKEQHKILLVRLTVANVFNSVTCVESLVSYVRGKFSFTLVIVRYCVRSS